MDASTLPSTLPSAADSGAAAGQGASTPPENEPAKVGGSFFDRLVRPFRAVDDPKGVLAARAAAGADSQQDAGEAAEKGAQAKPDGGTPDPKDGGAFKTYQSEEEHNRAIQAEVDRRERVRDARKAQETAAATRKQLRDNDPERYAELDRMAEEGSATATSIAGQVIDVYDTELLKPVIDRLPDDKRAELMKGPWSVEHRKAALETVLKHVADEGYERGLAEGQKKARENPTVRKEMLSQLRRDSEPLELVEAGGGSGSTVTTSQRMNAFLRGRRAG